LILSSRDFRYNGIDSEDMHLWNVQLSANMMEEPFSSNREIQEISIKDRDRPYFQRIQLSPLEFELNFAFTEAWDKTLMQQIKQWLIQPYFRPMIFSDDITIVDEVEVIDKIYYCIMVSDPKILHNGLNEGYCTLKFRCDSPYAYSPVTTTTLDCTSNPVGGTSLTIVNSGDVNCYPKVTFTKVLDGDSEADISIINTSNDNLESKFLTAKQASDTFTLTGGVIDGEVVSIGSDTFEFDIDDSISSGNIKVDISTGMTKTQATARLIVSNLIKDAELITIGDTIFEIDSDSSVVSGRTAIDISGNSTFASGTITLTAVPTDGQTIIIGKDKYEFDIEGITRSGIETDNIKVDITGLTTIDQVGAVLTSVINANTTEDITTSFSSTTDTLTITSTVGGTIGNSIKINKRLTGNTSGTTLTGGTDCSIADAIVAIVSAINSTIGTNFTASVPSPNPDNIIDITIDSGSIYDGSLGNVVVCTTTCTGASFNSTTFLGGLDCTSAQAATALYTAINASATESIVATNAVASKVVVTSSVAGKVGELELSDDVRYGSWLSDTLTGGDGIVAGEVITWDNERQTITTSLSNTYRHNDFNDQYLYLIPGTNVLTIKGKATFSFQLEYKYL